MQELHAFDRVRIAHDIDQLNELIERKQWLWENESDPDRKAAIAEELEQHAALLKQTKAYLQ